MYYNIQEEGTYVHIAFSSNNLPEEAANELQGQMATFLEEGNSAFALSFDKGVNTQGPVLRLSERLHEIVQKEDAILVAVAENDELADALQGVGIIAVPTISEAVDYIFMEQIERQLNTEDEDPQTT